MRYVYVNACLYIFLHIACIQALILRITTKAQDHESRVKDILFSTSTTKHPSRSNNPKHFSHRHSWCHSVQLPCNGHVVLGGPSPGLPTKLRKRTLSALEQKSSVRKKSKLRVELLTVTTKGTRYKSFQKAHVPPAKSPGSQPSTSNMGCKMICLLGPRSHVHLGAFLLPSALLNNLIFNQISTQSLVDQHPRPAHLRSRGMLS